VALRSLLASALRRALPPLCAAGVVVAPRAAAGQGCVPAKALPFQVGERASYAVHFGPLRVGSGAMEIAGVDTIRGEAVLHIRFTVRGGTFLYRVDDLMESWLEPCTLRSLRFSQELHEGRRRYRRRFDFFADTRTFLQEGKQPQPSVADPLDEASFFYFVRTQPLAVGGAYEYDRYFRPSANPVRLRVLRRETVRVPAGTFAAIVVQPIIRTSGIFSEGGRAELWIADDSTHAVLQVKSQLSFGSLNLYLEKYERGGNRTPAAVVSRAAPENR
jgi:hypothetical protein